MCNDHGVNMLRVDHMVTQFVEALKAADFRTRERMTEELRSRICMSCGDPDNPRCQCWNDE